MRWLGIVLAWAAWAACFAQTGDSDDPILSIGVFADHLIIVSIGGPLSGTEEQRAIAALFPDYPPIERRERRRGGTMSAWRLPIGRLQTIPIREIAQAAKLPTDSRLQISSSAPIVIDWGGEEPVAPSTQDNETTWSLSIDKAPDEIRVGWEPPAALRASSAYTFLSAWAGVFLGPILVIVFRRRRRTLAGVQIWPAAFALGLTVILTMLFLPVLSRNVSLHEFEAFFVYAVWFGKYFPEACFSIVLALPLMACTTLAAAGPKALFTGLMPKRRLKKVSRGLVKEYNRRTRLMTLGAYLSLLFLIPLVQWILKLDRRVIFSVAVIFSSAVTYLFAAAVINHRLNTQESLLLEAKYKDL